MWEKCSYLTVRTIEYSPGEFIYTLPNSTSPSEHLMQTQSATLTLAQPVGPFTWLSSEQRALLHHFATYASKITSCHSGMQREICSMLIPMALQTPSLLYATAALSAIHLQALNNRSESAKSAPDIARLMASSLEHLRKELQDASANNSDAILATARTLCLAEIHSGAIQPNSWRAHIEGAKALMVATDDSSRSSESFRRYLRRWYRSIVSLTALTANGPPIGDSEDSMLAKSSGEDYLDDYWGFTLGLSDIFRGIGAVAWRRQQILINHGQENSHETKEELHVQQQAMMLEASLRRLMGHNAASQPKFYPGVAEKLSGECIREFVLCNEAFQHSALIQIRRRLRRIPTTAPAVQRSVQRILECICQITPSAGLSPWAMLTTPLFIAGCEAQGADRDTVKRLLLLLHDTIRVPNVLQSLKFLEQYWIERSRMNEADWNHYLGKSYCAFYFEATGYVFVVLPEANYNSFPGG